MASQGMNYQELEVRKKLLLEELANTQNQIVENHASAEAIDIHHPERSTGWKKVPYLEYPKVMYHPAKLDPVREDLRLGTRRRNDANPTLAPLDVPHPRPLTKTVHNKEQERQAKAEGFLETPPQIELADSAQANAGVDPAILSVNVAPSQSRTSSRSSQASADAQASQSPAPAPDVARILELNSMNRDALVAHAAELGVVLDPDMSKADMISAIAYAPVVAG
jgi:hypothetical protein